MTTYEVFIKRFKTKTYQQKKVGIEVEIPIVKQTGEAVDYQLIRQLFLYLETQGFCLVKDDNIILEATIQTTIAPEHQTIITTDLGYSTLEIVLPPFDNLHTVNQYFRITIGYLLPFVQQHNCRLLGYGIHPLTQPSRRLLAPRQRYKGLEKIWTTNNIVPKSMGNDAHLLTISAGNQCHIDVSDVEAVRAINVLNASSGLQIALQANSPIWKGKIIKGYKAIREKFYDFLYTEDSQRSGVAPKFETLSGYFQYIANQTLFLVIRNNEVLQVFNYSFSEYLEQTSIIAKRLNGEKITITPNANDIHYHNTLFYLNARLVPNYGTIEVRMPCQQPPNDTMVTAALNLGLMENLAEAEAFFNQYEWAVWKQLRIEAIHHAFQAQLPNGQSIIPLIKQLLIIAQKGLKNRGLNEAIFLKPLFERLEKRQSPADIAIDIFNKKGMIGFLDLVSFSSSSSLNTTTNPIEKPLSN